MSVDHPQEPPHHPGGAAPAWRRTVRHGVLVVLVGLLGGMLGLTLANGVERPVGPFDAEVSLDLGSSGSTVRIAPLGSLQIDSHRGPLGIEVRLTELRPAEATAIAAEPERLETLGEGVETELRDAVVALLLRTAAGAAIGAAALGALVFRRPGRTAAATGVALVLLLAGAGVGRATFSPQAVSEPRFTGLLASAPGVVGDARDIVERFDQYRAQLAALVTNVSTLYAAGQALPTFEPDPDTLRVLHVSDLHLNPAAFDLIDSVVAQFSVNAVFDTGDLTDFGTDAEDAYVEQIDDLAVPYVYVRGNHDSLGTQEAVAEQPNGIVVDGGVREVLGRRVLGTGDPRFTPDSATRGSPEEEAQAVVTHGRLLRGQLRRAEPPVDVLLLHDPIVAAETVAGHVPLVLAGHTHQRDTYVVDDTLVLVQGSTGGAGLRGLEGEDPTPLTATVLYLDRETGQLQAFDDITLGGLGTSSVTIVRTVVTEDYLDAITREAEAVVPDTGPTPVPAPGDDDEPADVDPAATVPPTPAPAVSPLSPAAP
jgi:predicted MPP superfamily phosphohydrolase